MTNYRPVYIYHFSVKMYTGLSLVVSIVWRHFFIGTISCLVFVPHFLWTYLSLFSLLQKGIWFERIWIWPRRTCPSLWWHHWWVTISFLSASEAFYSAYKKWRHTGLPLVNWNVYCITSFIHRRYTELFSITSVSVPKEL